MSEAKKKELFKSPIKSIRAYCLECSGQQKGEVLNCLLDHCQLYPFRLGSNPNRKGIGKTT